MIFLKEIKAYDITKAVYFKKKKISSLGGRRPQGSRCLKLWMFGQSNWQSLGPDSKLFHLFQEAQMRTTTH